MADEENCCTESTQRKAGLLKNEVRLVKKKESNRYGICPIMNSLSFEKGFFIVIRACQMLTEKNDGITIVGLAGPSGSGKSIFTDKIINFMPNIAVISMDNYNDSSRVVDGNFDDPRLTDYDTLLKNIRDLKEGKQADVPIYDFKSSSRTGYRTVEVPSSGVVIIEGIYALSEHLRPLLDLRVSVKGGVHFDLVKRVLRDTQRAGQEPEEIIHQISETVYPMYKVYIEPDLQTADIKIINKFNPFKGFENPTYILKSSRSVTIDQIKTALSTSEELTETNEQTYDIYLLPPGEDPESCQSYLRMRNKNGKYSLMFEEWVTDSPFIISPRITFKVSVRLLGGLMALGYTIAAILKRSSHIFTDDRVCVKIDWLELLNRNYIQVLGKDRLVVKKVAEQLELDGSYIPRTYIEQIQLEKLLNEVMALPDDLKSKLSLDTDLVSIPKEVLSRTSTDMLATRKNKHLKSGLSHSYSYQGDKSLSKYMEYAAANNPRRQYDENQDSAAAAATKVANQGVVTQILEQVSSLNDRMDAFSFRVEELNSKLTIKDNYYIKQNMVSQAESYNGSSPTTHFSSGSMNGSVMHSSSSSSQFSMESPLMEQMQVISRGQRQITLQLDNLGSLIREKSGGNSHCGSKNSKSGMSNVDSFQNPRLLLTLAIGGLGIYLLRN